MNCILLPVPDQSPTHMEAVLINATAVHLKWRSPPVKTINGELQGYMIELRTNNTSGYFDRINVGTTPSLLLGDLTPGISYVVRVAAVTRAGHGPFSAAAFLRLDPATKTTNRNNQR